MLTPRIDTVFPFSIIRPGGGGIVQGASFGTQPGRFKLKRQSGLVTDLTRLEWGDKAIGETIDPNIAGVIDQPATLQIIRSNGNSSNEVPAIAQAGPGPLSCRLPPPSSLRSPSRPDRFRPSPPRPD